MFNMAYYKPSAKSNKNTFDHAITVRCTEEQRRLWTEAAQAKGMTLNQYIRIAANQLINKNSAKLYTFDTK